MKTSKTASLDGSTRDIFGILSSHKPAEEHSVLEIIAGNPVPYAWVIILIILFVITIYFALKSRK